jgi:hypothetical protein
VSSLRADIRDYLFAPLGTVLAAPLVPGLTAVALPICGGLLAHLTYARSLGLAVAVAIAATALTGVLDPLAALVVLPTLACVLWGTRALRTLDAWKFALVLTTVAFVSFVAVVAVGEALAGSSIVEAVREETAQAVEQSQEILAVSDFPEDVREDVSASLASAELVLAQTWPSAVLLTVALGAFLATAAMGFAAARRGVEVRRFPPLPQVDVSWHVVWPLIAGIVLLTAGTATDSPDSWYAALGWNLMIVTAAVLFVQGLAVAESLLRKAGLGLGWRLLLYGAFLWASGALFPLGAGIGLADLWLNMRRLPRGDASGGPVERTPDSD